MNLQEAYHASVVLHRADDNELMDRVQSRYRQVIQNDEELLLAPEFFDALARHWPGVTRAEVRLKAGNYDNELSRFRYDVVLVLGERQQLAPVAFWHDWDAEGRWRDSVMRRMTSYPAEAQGVRDLPDIRVSEAVAAWREMESDKTRYQTAKEIRQALQKHGENPDTLFSLAKWLGVDLIWQTLGGDGRYQAVFNPVWTVEKEREILPRADYHRYANNPTRRERQVALSHELKATLTRQLPKYMVPNAILVLDAFPLTPNGKIDRNRLPNPKVNNYGVQDYVAPRNSLEKSLVSIWQEALTLSQPPSVTDNFFELGGHSLLSAKVVTLIEEKLGYRISLKQFFQQPTIEAMALSMEQQTSDKDSSEEHGGIRWPLPKALQYKLESYVCSWGGERASTESLIFAHHVKGTLPPLFWVFQGDQEFAQLAKYLGDSQPLYGMRSGHLIMDYQEDDIQAFALRYVTEIERLYPTGPLFVGGNCQGGVIALAIAQHLLRRQRILPLAFVMEWSFGTQPYLGSVAFLYGQDSVFNPYLSFQHPHLFWQRSFPDHRIEMIPGAHGKFFVEPNIQGLSSTISRCMAEAIKNSPLFIPTSDRKAEITVLNLPNTFMSGGHYLLAVKLRNASTINWNRTDISGLMLGNQWLNTEDKFISRQDGKTPIPSLLAGQSTQLYLPIKAPEQAGLVHLNLSLIEEGVCWFKGADQGEIQFKINLIAPEAYTLPTFSSDITRHGAPILIGGTGGSGITVIAKVLAEAGIFLGEQTGSSDSTSMMENWSSSLLPYWNKPLPCAMEAIIRKDLEETVNNFLTTRDAEKNVSWLGLEAAIKRFFSSFFTPDLA
ncbi:hypothetical protein VZ94_18850 [Methylocucumis oryzae]|uniref:Carrier domain-containing protein n=1 Tax=Methylocucumis oryzae TaxID=1632867 RepID=A0A0F3IEU9_9GAMM|nr:hypothetical protein VZ94_18850 [Methylocucumis oryzae]